MLRGIIALAVVLSCAASAVAQRILLIPLDSRPAAGQFSQLIGRMAGENVSLPPTALLGRYTKPGNPDAILSWLDKQNMSVVDAVVVSTDMVSYGGLISSRVYETGLDVALQRLRRLAAFRAKHPKIPFFGMSAVMRLFPTSTRDSNAWMSALGRYAEAKERYRLFRDKNDLREMEVLRAQIPASAITSYEMARSRNHRVQEVLLRETKKGVFDYLILGQDDARPTGPHIAERARLKRIVENLQIGGSVYFCEGVDQLSNILVSRALLKKANWVPRVRIVYSDENGRRVIANYESKNVEQSVKDQVVASGARPWVAGTYDYTLWLNTPEPGTAPFENFVSLMLDEVDQGFPAGVADINLGKSGTADERLFAKLWEDNRMIRLLAYAGWNTAGNTMGTSIPAANVYLLARRLGDHELKRELAQREFVLHRFVNDYAYHKYTRPQAYKLIDSLPTASRQETYGHDFDLVNEFVREDMLRYLRDYYAQQFNGKRFYAGTKQYELSGIESASVSLPWPRAYEVRLDFRLQAREITAN